MMGRSARSSRARVRPGGAWAGATLALAAGAAAVALTGCSSSSSSSGPPAYCAARTNLENSIKGLTSLTASSGVSGLKSQVTAIGNNASKLVDQAKGDFPSQTSAITSSVNALKTSVAGLSSSPSGAQIATVTKDAGSVVSSVASFMSASSSKCS
jgi:hypothetical protein